MLNIFVATVAVKKIMAKKKGIDSKWEDDQCIIEVTFW